MSSSFDIKKYVIVEVIFQRIFEKEEKRKELKDNTEPYSEIDKRISFIFHAVTIQVVLF